MRTRRNMISNEERQANDDRATINFLREELEKAEARTRRQNEIIENLEKKLDEAGIEY